MALRYSSGSIGRMRERGAAASEEPRYSPGEGCLGCLWSALGQSSVWRQGVELWSIRKPLRE